MKNPQLAASLKGKNSRVFPLRSGMRQGFPLSPHLFNILLAVLAINVRQQKVKLKATKLVRKKKNFQMIYYI